MYHQSNTGFQEDINLTKMNKMLPGDGLNHEKSAAINK